MFYISLVIIIIILYFRQSVILSDDNGQYNNKLVVFSTQYCTLVKEGRHGNVPIKEKTPVKQGTGSHGNNNQFCYFDFFLSVQTTVTSFNELNSSIKVYSTCTL